MIGGYFCAACGIVHAEASAPVVGEYALSVQQVRIIREIVRMRVLSSDTDRCLGLVEIAALLGEPWLRTGEPAKLGSGVLRLVLE